MRSLCSLFLAVVFAAFLTVLTLVVCESTINKPPITQPPISVADQLHACVVSIKFDGSWGSGAFRVTRDGQVWVWTCGHIINEARHEVTNADGTETVTFDHVLVRRVLTHDGVCTGTVDLMTEVIRFSNEQDLALLRVIDKNFKPPQSMRFYMEPRAPPIGSHLMHAGAPDEDSRLILTTGILVQHHSLVPHFPLFYDMMTVPIIPGCSGGPVVMANDGRCVGIFVIYRRTGTWTWMVPVRRMHTWALDNGIAFTMDDNLPIPTDTELSRQPVEARPCHMDEGGAAHPTFHP